MTERAAVSAWVLMAWDGPRLYAESWEPVAVFDHEPTMRERGEALIRAHRAGRIPWPTLRGPDDARVIRPNLRDPYRLGRISDYTEVREVPA